MRINRLVTTSMRLTVCLFALCVASGSSVQAANEAPGFFYDQTFKDDTGEHRYIVYVPMGYVPGKATPAILFLHGAGERGKDNRLQLTTGLAPYVQARVKTFPFLVVFPQCESTEARILEAWQAGSPDGRRALMALDDAQKKFSIDPKRVVLSGWSMGGYGAWSLGMAEPSRWSAVVPLAGGGDISKVGQLKDVPVWAFHGSLDRLVKAESDHKMVDALKEAGGTATFTEFPEVGHYLCDSVYGNDAVIQWMLDPRKASAELSNTPLVKPIVPIKVPFVPAVEIPNAVGLRLGNDALAAMSYAIPETVPKEILTGRLNDMFDSTVAQGRSFGIRFSGISYRGQLDRVLARGYAKDRVLIQLGARNIVLTIGGTSVTGERHAAQAGPINVMIGFQRPVWLNLELQPFIADRRIRMKVISSAFQIPPDNFSVSQPAGVSTQGFGMTEEAVSSGLVSGLYGARARMEKEVLAIVPGIVEQLEKSLELPDTASPVSQSGDVISKLWPLPIYPPRLRVWPQQVSTDENGISLIVGITAASLEPYSPAKPLKVIDETPATLDRLPTDKALHAAVAPQILTPLTQMAIDADQLKLDLLDIPEPLFAKMADRATLQEIIPDLKQYGENLQVQSSLRVIKALRAGDPETPTADSSKPFNFQLSGVQISVAIKTDPAQKEWKPCAVFELNVTEQVKATLTKPTHEQRFVSLDWQPDAAIQGTSKFAEGYEAKDSNINTNGYVEMFKQAWQTFSKGTSAAAMEVPDLKLGGSRLRLADLDWKSPLIEVTYKLARIKITNTTDKPFTYETKAPTSPWGEPLTLKAGESHEFEIPYPLTYRSRNAAGATEIYTLPVGTHVEYRVPVTGGPARLFTATPLAAQ